jgi:hypothetical protein
MTRAIYGGFKSGFRDISNEWIGKNTLTLVIVMNLSILTLGLVARPDVMGILEYDGLCV